MPLGLFSSRPGWGCGRGGGRRRDKVIPRELVALWRRAGGITLAEVRFVRRLVSSHALQLVQFM